MCPVRVVRGGMARVEADRFGIPGYTNATYGDSFADVYDEWYADLGDHDFVDALVRHLPEGPARVLELGVGTGRLLSRLAGTRGGIDGLTGVDTSEQMLARARLVPELVSTDLLVHDFSDELPAGPFDVVFCGYNTLFNLPDHSSITNALRLARNVLPVDGFLLIDAFVPSADGPNDDVSVRSVTVDSVVLSVSRHDKGAQRITGQFVEMEQGKPLVLRPWSVRYMTPDQLDAAAGAAGLRLVSRHENGNGTPFSDGSRRHVSVYSPA